MHGRWPNQMPLIGQLLRYVISGGIAALVHLAVLALLVELTPTPPTLASAIGFCCAVPVNYGLQHRYVWRKDGLHGRFFVRYVGVTLFTLGINTALFWLLSSGLGVYYLLSQIVTIGIVVGINFFLNRNFTFTSPSPAETQ